MTTEATPQGLALTEGFGFTVTAQPLEWEPHGDGDWADKYCGFYISHSPEDDAEAPYHAAWGEGDSESFGTLDEAKAWCQREIDGWVRRFAVVKPNVRANRDTEAR